MVEVVDWNQQRPCSLGDFSGDFQDGEQGEELGVVVLVGRFVFCVSGHAVIAPLID